MMDLYQLETFVTIAQERSFSRAANRLHRTQSAISQTIAKLEEDLNETLFDRSSRNGTLTDAGRLLLRYAEELLNLRTEARDALDEMRQLHRGKLTIAANEFTSLCLLPVLKEFHRLHPTIKIEMQRALASHVPAQVLNHKVEFGVLSFDPEDDQLTSIVIYRDDLVFVVYPEHPLASAKRVSIKDLGAESFIAHNVVSPYRLKVIEAFKRNKTTLNMPIELPTVEAIKEFVRMGNGVAIVPRISIGTELRNGDLVEIQVPELRLDRKVRLVLRKGSAMSHSARAFLKVCESFAGSAGGRYVFQEERRSRNAAKAKVHVHGSAR